MPTLLVTNARLITVPAGADDPGYVERGWMLVDGGRIAAIGEGDAPAASADEVLDVDGAFVAPGFVSSHSHLFTSGLRGLGVSETLYGWCDSMLGFTAHLSPEDMYWSTLHGSLDFLANGVTTAYNFTDPLQAWESMVDGQRVGGDAPLRDLSYHTRQADGCLDSGIRFVDAIAMDVSTGTDEEIFDRFAAEVSHTRSLDADFALGASIMGQVQWSPRPEAAEFEVEAMRRFGVTNHAHFLESPEAVPLQQAKFAMYQDAGALGPDMMFGHFIQTTPEIIQATAEGGAAMSWQPASNGRLASGVALVPEMLDLGIRVGMGLDDQACTDISDPWGNMRAGIFMQRARTKDPMSMTPERVLRLHTLGSAQILGVDDRVGSLEVGKFADFVVVDPRTPDVGPLWHPVRNYVLSMSLRNLKRVYVGGELVSEEGRSTNPLAAEATARLHADLPAAATEFGHPR
jgi:cytosine/adenosine deaminase-related metal-dependent hydrolase